jgi:multidrug efflux pump subunit AcrA (membrane-fusion protein)
VTIKELSLELAKVQQAQYKREYEETKILVDRMKLRSAFDGVVARLSAGVGESMEAGKDVVRVVKIDPLWIDAPVPEDQAEGLRVGQAAQVKYDDRDEMIVGKVVFKSPVIEPGSRTLTIRIELPNGEKRAAGKHVTVSFPPEQRKAPVAAMDIGHETGQGYGGQAGTPQDKERE